MTQVQRSNHTEVRKHLEMKKHIPSFGVKLKQYLERSSLALDTHILQEKRTEE